MLSLMLLFFFGSFMLGIFWVCVFLVASFLIYLVAWLLSVFGIYMDISGDKNICLLFLVVFGISWWVFNVSNIGYALFIWLTGSFMLFRSADLFKIGSC